MPMSLPMPLLPWTFSGLIGARWRAPERTRRERARRRPLGALLFLLLLGPACATPAPVPDQGAGLTPLLWRASRPGAGELFLFGSVHLGDRPGGAYGPAVEAAFADSDELVVEVDLAALSAAEAERARAAHALLPPGRQLRDVLSADTYRRLSARLAERDLPMVSVAAMQPWAVASLLALLEFQAAGYEFDRGVDRQLIDRAADRLPTRGLETMESQLAMLSGLPLETQELMIVDMLERTEAVQQEVGDLMDAWSRGDEEQLTALLFAPLDEHPELAGFYEAVFFARNEQMTDRLAALSADGRGRFVVLGAGHMVGPRGIPALLAARGFTVAKLQPH